MQENATVETTAKEQVEQVLAGKILKRLAKLGATEEGQLSHAVSTVQIDHGRNGFAHAHKTTKTVARQVVANVIRKLGELGMIRKISAAGEIFIARRDVTRKELLAAIKLSVSESRYSEYAATKPGRRQRYRDEQTGFEMVRVVPLDDDDATESAAHRFTVKGLMADGPDAMTYEGSVTGALDAEEIPAINHEAFDVGPVARKPLSELAKRRIAHQHRIGQGPRNARRARARYLKTDPVMRQWFARREMGKDAKREEHRASPQEGYDDH